MVVKLNVSGDIFGTVSDVAISGTRRFCIIANRATPRADPSLTKYFRKSRRGSMRPCGQHAGLHAYPNLRWRRYLIPRHIGNMFRSSSVYVRRETAIEVPGLGLSIHLRNQFGQRESHPDWLGRDRWLTDCTATVFWTCTRESHWYL